MMPTGMDRRSVLQAVGVGLVGSMAGCAGGNTGSPGSTTNGGEGGTEDTPAATFSTAGDDTTLIDPSRLQFLSVGDLPDGDWKVTDDPSTPSPGANRTKTFLN